MGARHVRHKFSSGYAVANIIGEINIRAETPNIPIDGVYEPQTCRYLP